jgi:hypothetical protein
MTPLADACFVGLCRPGCAPRIGHHDPSFGLDAGRVFQDLREAFALLRRHRVAVHRLQWEFEGGLLLATNHDEVLRLLVSRRPAHRLGELWAVLEEMQ